MEIVKIVNDKTSQNSYLIVKDNNAILIDAGVVVSKIEEALNVFSYKPKLNAVFLTHAHFDHIIELDNIIKKFDCPVYIFKSGKSMLYKEDQNMSILDKPFKIKNKENIKIFKDEQVIDVCGVEVTCYNTPGHTIDSSCFQVENNLFTGDTVFRTDIGRYDLYSGNENMLMISLRRIRDEFNDNIDTFYPGHGLNFNKEELDYNVTRIIGE